MISALTVSDASDYSPGFVYVRWQADIQSGVVIKIDGQVFGATSSAVGSSNSALMPLSPGTHTICIEEGNY